MQSVGLGLNPMGSGVAHPYNDNMLDNCQNTYS